MKKVIAALVLGIGAPAALAANWQVISNNDTRVIYIDASSIVLKSGYVRSWFRASLAQAEEFKGSPGYGARYKSYRQMALFDCAERELDVVAGSYYAGDAWDGEMIGSENARVGEKPQLRPVAPDTVGETMLEAACSAVRKSKRPQS